MKASVAYLFLGLYRHVEDGFCEASAEKGFDRLV
jgi:hypothetical protein